MLGISAWHLLHRQTSVNSGAFLKTFRMGAIAGLVGALCVMGTGHAQGKELARIQPMKLAAMEGMYETANPAGLSLFTVIDEKSQIETYSIKIPSLVSLLVYNSPTGQILGMRDVQTQYQAQYGPANYIPSIFLCYWSFRAMVGVGMAMIALAGLAVLLSVMLKRPIPRLLLLILPWAIALPYIGNASGWILTEVGRFPWLVQGVLRLDQGVSPGVPASSVLISLAVFTLLYAGLILTTIQLFRHHAKAGITPNDLSGANASH